MLDFQIQQFPLRLGLAEGMEPHQAPPGTLLTAENACWKKSGLIGKRFGNTPLNTSIIGGGSITAGARLLTRGAELCCIDGANLYSYSPGGTAWRNVGAVPNVGMTWSTILDPSTGAQASDAAYGNGYVIHAWVTGDPTASVGSLLYVQILDAVSGAVVMAPLQLLGSTANVFGVRVLVVGTSAIVLTQRGAASPFAIYATSIDLTTTAFTQTTNASLRSDLATRANFSPWDACVVGSTFVLAYNRTGPVVALESYSAALVSQASGTISSEANGCDVISIDGTPGEVLYVLYCQGVATPRPMRIAIANPATLAQTVAPVTIETPIAGSSPVFAGVCRFDSTNCIAVYSYVLGDLSVRTTAYKISAAALVDTSTQRGTWWVFASSRPFMMGGKCYLATTDWGIAAKSTFAGLNSGLVEVETSGIGATTPFVPFRFVGTIDLLLGGRAAFPGPLPGFVTSGINTMTACLPFQATAPASLSNWRQGLRLVTLSKGASLPLDMWRSVTVGPELYISGGALSAHDGYITFDYGFPRAPIITSATTSAAGGVIAPPGTYLYGTHEEFRSAAGILHRSPTTTSASVTTAGVTSSNTLAIVGVNGSTKQNLGTGFGALLDALPTLLPIYRSVVNGASYFRLTWEPGFNVASVNETQAAVTFLDTRADTSIDGVVQRLDARPLLYTTGGILDDYAPPANTTMFRHADRLWALAGDGFTWWYSKAFQDDLGTAPGFNPAFRLSFAETQTAGASMDDKAIFFSATGVRYMLGTGPAPNGQNSDFTTPTVIQSDVGCTNARSVVGTPDGVMFLSARGIYLLTRGLELVWIGRPVKDTLAAYPNVTSAVLVAKQNQVRFTCNNANSTAGITLVFDYVEKQWAVFKNWDSGLYGTPIADACMYGSSYAFICPNGQVYVETETTYLDNGNYVPMTLETSWINAGGPLTFQSVRNFTLHGISNTDHDLTIQCGFDTDPSYPQSVTFAATSPVVAVGPLEECNVSIGTRRKCEAIRFKISDATPSAGTLGTGQGPSFDMIGLEVGNKRGFKPDAATKKG